MYTERDIRAARARQRIIHKYMGEGKLLRNGEVVYRIDPVLFHNAIQTNRAVYGVDNIWDEPEFVRDMCRRHPEIVIKNKGRLFAVTEIRNSKRLTRFGRATWSKVYG